MRNKRGFLRILEAFISIIIVLGVVVFLYVNQVQKPNQEEAINEIIDIIISHLSNEEELRKAILESDEEKIENEIRKFIPESGELDFRFRICDINEICDCIERECMMRNIYSREAVISVTLESEELKPKIFSIFLWEK
ncbi:MAG: hypothetical protein QXH60_03170 [Candidatus Pacearchaeota archaeon]